MSSKVINIYLGNHNPGSITDFVDFFAEEVRACGMSPILSYQLFTDTKNLVIEAFNKDVNRFIKKNFTKYDDRLIMVATEIVKDGVLNSTMPGKDEVQEGWYNTKAKHWVRRTRYFFDALEYFSTIICVSEEIYESLQSLGLKSKLVYWQPKFYGSLNDFESRWLDKNVNVAKSHHLFYSGSLTSYRQSQLDQIVDAEMTVMLAKQDTPDSIRHKLTRQTAFTLGPKHYKNTIQLSKMRALWCLNNLYPFAMERCKAKTDLDDYCVFYDEVSDLVNLSKDINSTYRECLDKNFNFAQTTSSTPSVFEGV